MVATDAAAHKIDALVPIEVLIAPPLSVSHKQIFTLLSGPSFTVIRRWCPEVLTKPFRRETGLSRRSVQSWMESFPKSDNSQRRCRRNWRVGEIARFLVRTARAKCQLPCLGSIDIRPAYPIPFAQNRYRGLARSSSGCSGFPKVAKPPVTGQFICVPYRRVKSHFLSLKLLRIR